MTAIIWSDRARDELYSILAYLAERSPQSARHLVDSIQKKVQRLERFPESGRKVPEFPDWQPTLRELIIENYRLVYVLRGKRIEVLTLFHGRRRFKKISLH